VKQANDLAENLAGSDEAKARAIQELQEFVGATPKRPLMYINIELMRLPDETRDVVRYAGDYIDQLIKHYAHENGSWGALKKSLGNNLTSLINKLPKPLLQSLKNFNDVIYVNAKHSWDVGSRPHLFSAKEAIFVCFIMKELAGQIIAISPKAKLYSENKINDYYN